MDSGLESAGEAGGPGRRAARWWTPPQLWFILLQALVVLCYAGGIHLLNPDYLSPLWLTPAGRRLLITAAVLLGGDFAAVLLLGGLLNVILPPDKPDATVWRILIQFVVATLLGLLLLLPVLMILHSGPAAIQIMENLSRPT